MEEYSEDNAGFNQSWELAKDSEYYARGNGQIQQWFSTEGPFQQDPYSPYQPNFHSQPQPTFHSPSFQNPYHNNQLYLPESDQNFFYHPDSFPNFKTPSYDSFPQFQNQEQLFYPQPHAHPQTEHEYYPQSYPNMEFQQEEQQVNDPQPPLLSEDAAAFAAILEALKPNSEWFLKREEEEKEFISVMQEAGFPWRNSEEAMEDNREEEEKEFTLVDRQKWSLEVEERETGAKGEQFREKEELEQEEMGGSEESAPSLSLHTEQKLPLQSERGITSGVTQDSELREEKEGEVVEPYLHLAELELPFPAALNRKLKQKEEEEQGKKLDKAELLSLLLPKEEEAVESDCRECWLYLHSAQEHHAMQQQKESKKKKLEAVHCTLLEGEKEATIEELTCEDLDILVQEVDHLLQHSSSSKEQGEKDQLSPYSLQLHRIKEKGVEDFTWADFDFLLHEDNSIKAGQHQFKDEKRKEEEQKETRTPDLHKHEVAELHHPQDTTPRHKEAAAYPSNANSFSFEFELTLNQFLLSLNVFISGDKLQTKQLNLKTLYKLQSEFLYGEVFMRGANGDGVLWNIKVHPP